MISIFRKYTKLIVYCIVITIIPGFILWGVSSAILSHKKSYAGYVFGKKVSILDYNNTYKSIEVLNKVRYGQFYSMLAPYINISRQTWQHIVLTKRASKEGIIYSNKEVVSSVESSPIFKGKNGVFSKAYYLQIVSQVFRMLPQNYEETIGSQLLVEKLSQIHNPSFPISSSRAQLKQKLSSLHCKVHRVHFPLSSFKTKEPTEEETKAFFQSNSDSFFYPEQTQFQYIVIKKSDIPKVQTVITEEDIKDYYEENKNSYKVKDDPLTYKPLEEVHLEIRDKIQQQYQAEEESAFTEEVVNSLWDNTPLNDVAQSLNTSVQVSDFYSKENLPKYPLSNIAQEVLNIPLGEYSEPILSGDAYYIAKRSSNIPRKQLTYQESLPEIKKQLKYEQQKQESLKKANQTYRDIGSSKESLQNLESFKNHEFKDLKQSEVTSSPFLPEKHRNEIFLLEKQSISQPYWTNDGYSLYWTEEKVIEKPDEQNTLENNIKSLQSSDKALQKDWINQLNKQAGVKTNPNLFKQENPLDTPAGMFDQLS